MHLIYPSLMELIAHLEEKSKKAICKTISSDLKKNMKSYFNYMVDPLDSNFDPIVITATYLSPVHRHILNEEQVQVAKDHVKDLLRTYDEDEQDVRVEDGHGVGGEEQKTTITIPGLKFLSKTILQASNNANLSQLLRTRTLVTFQIVCFSPPLGFRKSSKQPSIYYG